MSAEAGDSADEQARVAAARQAGRVTFMGLELVVLPDALVPRRETELAAGAAIGALSALGGDARAIDMCCGAGNLACAMAHHVPGAHVWASDLTDGAVGNARANVAHLGLGGRVDVFQGDLFGPLGGLGLEGTIDLVACNPPYISTARLEKDRSVLLEHEPRAAFDGGPYGLSIHQRVIKEALPFLKAGGRLLFEIGLGQERQLDLLFRRVGAYSPPEPLKDASGNVRAVMAQKVG